MTERNKNAMRMYDIIMNKRNGSALTDEEIQLNHVLNSGRIAIRPNGVQF